MRPSETPQQALERELREELGVTADIGDVVASVQHRYSEMRDAVKILFFRARVNQMPRNLAFERMLWVHRRDLQRYDFLPADLHVLRRLTRGEI